MSAAGRGEQLLYGEDRGLSLRLPQSPPGLLTRWWLLMPRVTPWGQEGRGLQKGKLSL